MNNFEKIVIIVTLIAGLIGGVLLIALKFPPIIPSILISMSISVLVYYFLGGIKEAGFNMGPIKMGGSIAALIGCAFFINHSLEPQMSEKPVVDKLSINKKFEIVNQQNTKLGDLPLKDYSIRLNKEQNVILCDSIKLGRIANSNFIKLHLFNKIDFNDYSEIYFNLQLSPFRAELDKNRGGLDSRRYKNAYNSLPFEIKPEFYEGSDKTMVRNRRTKETIGYYRLERHEICLITDFVHSDSKIYLIRVRQLDRQSDNNFVQYQVMGFSCKKV